jgi:multicomponent Na+:H+ antiporter subunit E
MPPSHAAIVVKRLVLLGLVWLAVTGAEAEALVLGLAVVPAATALSLRLMPPGARRVSLVVLARLAPGFLARSVQGGVDVARRALDPRLPLSPGWVTVPSRLPPGAARVVVGGEFSLLPGTLVAGSRGGALLVHALDTGQDVAGDVARAEAGLLAALPPARGGA